MKFILGKKIEMSQKFRENGNTVPLTVIEAGPCFVTQIRNKDKEGYQSVQIGFGVKKNIKKPLKGHLKDLDNMGPVLLEKNKGFRYLKEFRVDKIDYKKGDKIDISIFKVGEMVQVTGISKGKGFQGVVKRHNFRGGPKTHGDKDQLRMPGSIGATAPQRVFKGMRMAGRMGSDRVTVKNLEIIEVIPEKNLLLVKGPVPGGRNNLLEIYES